MIDAENENRAEQFSGPATAVGDGCDGIMGTYPFAYEDTSGKYGSELLKSLKNWQ